jgi:hypothetical protein
MPYRSPESKSDYIKKLFDEGRDAGRAEGRAEEARRILLTVLAARRVELSLDRRSVVERCADVNLVERWIERAAVATLEDEVFE